MKVRGPNGFVIEVGEHIATALVGDGTRGYEFVPDEPAKRGPGRPRKTDTEK
jgi:hypothetical protein